MSEELTEVSKNSRLAKPLPPTEFLKECFDYNPETGSLKWKFRPRHHFGPKGGHLAFNKRWPGTEAGSKLSDKTGRRTRIAIGFNSHGKLDFYGAHRIIFAMMGAQVPVGCYIDHINGDPWDNRWANLRIATPSQNSQNKLCHSRKAPKIMGVCSHRPGYYRARIFLNGKNMHLGTFTKIEDAIAARRAAEDEYFKEFARKREASEPAPHP